MRRMDRPWGMLSDSSRRILVDLLVHGPTSRADLARQSGVSPASLTRITRSMLESGLLTEAAAVSIPIGRPSYPMDVNTDRVHVIGINLTATTMHLVRTDLRAAVLEVVDQPLPSTGSAEVVNTIIEAVRAQCKKDPTVFVVGVSLAGPISPADGVVSSSPFLGWHDVPLGRLVQAGTGLPTTVENDVRALTAAEHWFGAAAGVADFALITIGAGVGCGIVVEDCLLDGNRGGVGQIGHLPVTASGPLCEEGHRGCARSYLSSALIVQQVRSATGHDQLDYEQVLSMAAAGHPVASRVVNDAGRALGVIIGTVAAVTAPRRS